MKKSKIEIKYDLKEEIQSIEDKGYNTILINEKECKDKRRFTKIFDIKLNELIFKKDINRKYIDFFILLVNINSRYIEPDLNLINLSLKEIADNMEYTIGHIYNCLKVLKQENLIDYYKKGRNNYIVINPCYYARFYNIKYMYFLENAFMSENISITDIIDRINLLKNTRHNTKNKYINNQIKEYLHQEF